MTAVVSNAFNIQIVASASPYANWSIGQYQRIFTGTDGNYGLFANEPYPGILAFSGATVDTSRNRLMLFGGGHGDYAGNEIWTMDLLNPSAKFTQRSDKTFFYAEQENEAYAYSDNVNRPGAYINGSPISRHTTYGNIYVSSLDEMWATGGSTWSGGYNSYKSANDGDGEAMWNSYPNLPCDLWGFAPSSGEWIYKGSALLDSGPYQLPMVPGAALVYSSTRNTVYAYVNQAKTGAYYPERFGTAPYWGDGAYQVAASGQPRMWECNPATGAWTAHANGAPAINHTLFAVDTANDRIIMVGKTATSLREVWAYPLATKVWTKITAISGTEPPIPNYEEGDRIVYSTLTGRILYCSGNVVGGGGLYALTVNAANTTGVWEQITPTGTFVGLTQAHYGCYDSTNGLYVQPVKVAAPRYAIDVYVVKA
jgi:hypothetical protein